MEKENYILYRLQLTQKYLDTDPYFSAFSECIDSYKRLNVEYCCIVWIYETIGGVSFLPYPAYMLMDDEVYQLKKLY
jgi:hypothetical protein